MRIVRATLVALFAALTLGVPAYAGSQATITVTFTDDCRDFTAHSTKDISHVVLHYADGRVVKDESISTPDHTVDGGTGDEIDVADVKSGTTRVSFRCDNGGSPPVAVLEIRMSPGCRIFTSSTGEPFYWCLNGVTNDQRTVYVDPGGKKIDMGCLPTEPLCFEITVRGTGSTDPDDDLTSWSIAFDDGAVAGGDWSTTPPDAVTHEYAGLQACPTTYCHITLTVTDSRGLVATDTVELAFFDQTPD